MSEQTISTTSPVDVEALRQEVRAKYRAVADEPTGHHFHTGKDAARQVGYAPEQVDAFPDEVVACFAGVASPFALRQLRAGERVVDVGCGAGFDSLLAARTVGPEGSVIGVDMTPEMRQRAERNISETGLGHVEIRPGLAEELPVEDGWADVVISNGVINLCGDKGKVLAEIRRVLRPGGVLQFADIANGRPVPTEALRDIDLWTA